MRVSHGLNIATDPQLVTWAKPTVGWWVGGIVFFSCKYFYPWVGSSPQGPIV